MLKLFWFVRTKHIAIYNKLIVHKEFDKFTYNALHDVLSLIVESALPTIWLVWSISNPSLFIETTRISLIRLNSKSSWINACSSRPYSEWGTRTISCLLL